jgi:hypothetical protein
MLKNILKLEGAQKLTKNEQKSINGGTYIQLDEPKCWSPNTMTWSRSNCQ